MAKKRRITLELDAPLDLEAYADLAHAVWSTAQAVVRQGSFTLIHDGINSTRDLNDRWEHVSRAVWRDR